MHIFWKICVFFALLCSPTYLFASFEIAEVLPNTSDDSNLEYITLKNITLSSQSLSGYTLEDASGKRYTFTGGILQSKERKQFFRPQTKIVLNNTDEILRLFSNTGSKIDEVSYKTSSKGIFLSFEDIEIENEEAYISGEVYVSDEVIISPPDVISTPVEIKTRPEVQFLLQRPSYITQSGSSDIYICDSKQSECKVNFDLSSSFTSQFPATDYRCELDFGLGFLTGEEQKCNPNTIIFPLGESKARFRVIHKSDERVFSEKTIHIFSQKYESFLTSQNISGPSGGESISQSPRIQILDPMIEIQSGVTGLGTNFFCEKELCKANLKYKKIHSLERCYWDFGAGETTGESSRKTCNPGIVTFGSGVHELSLKVYESSREENAQTVKFFIHNLQKTPEKILEKENLEEKILLPQIFGSIQFQGKLSKEKILSDKVLKCMGVQKCFVNLEGILSEKPKKGRKFRYVWLQNGEVFSEKRNPAGIWFLQGNHEVIFQVYEADILQSEARWSIIVSQEKSTSLTNSGNISQETLFLDRNYSGLIFGNILPNPKGNDIKEFIEIKNISGEPRQLGGCFIADSSKKYVLPDEILEIGTSRYFFRGETGITLGNNKETLTLSCGEKVLETQSFERSIAEDELLSGEVFSGFSLGEIKILIPENLQESYLEKSLSLSFLILKRDGLKISGITFPNTKIELLSEDKVVLTLRSDASGKFLLKTKDVLAGVYHFDIRLSQGTSDYTFGDFKTLTITPAQRASWFQKAVRKKKPSIVKIPKLLVSREIPADIGQTEAELSMQEKVFFLFLLCIIGLLVFGHIFFLSFPKKLLSAFAPPVEIMRFQTRQKLVLLGV